ncbi:hypothetical protein [Dokdonia sp. R86516]|uniref:hypothetical protein n=1 Tax=Dokdonia sp. R86516 TaxID=3093856 RepID=UPI0037CA400B
MLKAFTLYSLALTLSFSILGPAFLALLDNEADIEVVQDIEEEKSETKKELEEYEKFLSDLVLYSIEVDETADLCSYSYFMSTYDHTQDINIPPPDYSLL